MKGKFARIYVGDTLHCEVSLNGAGTYDDAIQTYELFVERYKHRKVSDVSMRVFTHDFDGNEKELTKEN